MDACERVGSARVDGWVGVLCSVVIVVGPATGVVRGSESR